MDKYVSYSSPRKWLHWLTVVCLFALFPLGKWMTARAQANLWDDLTNLIYGWHKLIGMAVLILIVLRIVAKFAWPDPAYGPGMSAAVRALAKSVHGLMYLLLLVVPLLGWAGVTAFPALITVAGYHLPAMPGIPKDQALAKQIFEIHGTLAMVLLVLVVGHVAAALKHLFIDKDGVFQRMTR